MSYGYTFSMHTEVRLFGSPSYRVADEWRPLPLDKRGVLLALLAHAEDGWPRTRLIKLFWPHATAAQGRVNLRGLLTRVRDVDPVQRLTLHGERLEWDVRCDTRDFRAAVVEERWLDAIGTYSAPFMRDMELTEVDEINAWIELERRELDNGFGLASDRAAEAFAAAGALQAVEDIWQKAIERDPFDETVVESALRLATRYSPLAVAALRLLDRFTTHMRDCLEAEPSSHVTRLGSGLRDNESLREAGIGPVPVTSQRAPPPHHGVRRTGLPAAITPVVHRDVEMAQVANLLESAADRCVTIVGPGGIGKTQVALQTARHLATNAHTECWFVPLSGIDSDELIDTAVAQSTGVRLHGSTPAGKQLLAHFRDRSALLVLDNLEHLPGSAAFIEKLLEACPGVRILATSRAPLRSGAADSIGETFALAGMSYPDDPNAPEFEEHDGVALFLLRARQATASFRLHQAERPDLITICRAVGGAPLGIELAAAWVGSLTLADIARALTTADNGLDRELLDVPTRHWSLRAAFDQSWRLLSATERSALAALSVFSGGFTAEAAEHVSASGPRTLAALVEWSLVQLVGQGRFDLHQLIKQFALQYLNADLATENAARDRHTQYYADLVAREGRWFRGGAAQVRALEVVYDDLANVRTAWEHARAERDAVALTSFLPMFHVYEIRGLYREGAETFGLSAAALPTRSKARALSLTGQSVLLGRQDRLAECRATIDESLAILDELGETDGLTLLHLGVLEYMEGDVEAAAATWKRTAAEAERLGDAWSRNGAVSNLGVLTWNQGDTTTARELFHEGMPQGPEQEDRWSLSMSLVNLGALDIQTGDLESAEAHLTAALSTATSISQQPMVLETHYQLGRLAIVKGDMSTAAEHFTRCADEAEASGDEHWLAAAREQLASLGNPTR